MYIGKQSGVALLIILMLISISMILTSLMVEVNLLAIHMEENYVAKYMALCATENALSEIKIWLNTLNSPPAPMASCTLIQCITEFKSIEERDLTDLSWWKNHAAAAGLTPVRSYALIRELQQDKDSQARPIASYYQVLVIAYSADEQAMTLIQTTFLKAFDPTGLATKPSRQLSWQQLR